MAQEIWAVAAVTLIGAWTAGGLNLAARRQRENDSPGAVRLSVVSIVVSVATLLADIVLLLAARLYWFVWGLAAACVLVYGTVGAVVLIALLRKRRGRVAGGEGPRPSSHGPR